MQIWADNSKVHVRRLPPILKNCQAWLTPFKNLTGPVCPAPDRFNQLTKVARRQNLTWAHDILRDSFISNRAAIVENLFKVAEEAGNSERVIRESYLKRVTEKEAQAYFSVVPARGWKPEGIEEMQVG